MNIITTPACWCYNEINVLFLGWGVSIFCKHYHYHYCFISNSTKVTKLDI